MLWYGLVLVRIRFQHLEITKSLEAGTGHTGSVGLVWL